MITAGAHQIAEEDADLVDSAQWNGSRLVDEAA